MGFYTDVFKLITPKIIGVQQKHQLYGYAHQRKNGLNGYSRKARTMLIARDQRYLT